MSHEAEPTPEPQPDIHWVLRETPWDEAAIERAIQKFYDDPAHEESDVNPCRTKAELIFRRGQLEADRESLLEQLAALDARIDHQDRELRNHEAMMTLWGEHHKPHQAYRRCFCVDCLVGARLKELEEAAAAPAQVLPLPDNVIPLPQLTVESQPPLPPANAASA